MKKKGNNQFALKKNGIHQKTIIVGIVILLGFFGYYFRYWPFYELKAHEQFGLYPVCLIDESGNVKNTIFHVSQSLYHLPARLGTFPDGGGDGIKIHSNGIIYNYNVKSEAIQNSNQDVVKISKELGLEDVKKTKSEIHGFGYLSGSECRKLVQIIYIDKTPYLSINTNGKEKLFTRKDLNLENPIKYWNKF